MNVVMASGGRLIELQGTAEGQPFDRTALDALLELAASGIARIEEAQRAATRLPPPGLRRRTMRALLATTNAHKARELRSLLGFESTQRASRSTRPERRSPRTRCSRPAPRPGSRRRHDRARRGLRYRGRRPRRRARRPLGALRRARTTPPAGARCSRAWTVSTTAAPPTCARSRRCFPTGASSSSRGGSRAARRRRARHGGLRVRPDLRPRGRAADRRRARAGAQGRDLASRARSARRSRPGSESDA